MPTRFVWRFGGRQVGGRGLPEGGPGSALRASLLLLMPLRLPLLQVHLCGSFTRWVETVPMAPVEGNPGVFAVVVHLPPG